RHTRSTRDWSSDVCSSDLARDELHRHERPAVLDLTELEDADQSWMTRRCRDNRATHALDRLRGVRAGERAGQKPDRDRVAGRFEIGRASCRERAWRAVREG